MHILENRVEGDISFLVRFWNYLIFPLRQPYSLLRQLCCLSSQASGCKHTFLGAFAELQKATVSFVMSVCLSDRPSARIEQLGSHWTDFYEI
jgi:hypothetical protein